MGREVRMVPPGWQHPQEADGRYKPLLDGSFEKALAEWTEGKKKWEEGFRENWGAKEGEPKWKPKEADETCSWVEWNGSKPQKRDYMPTFPEGTATHLMMYETCTEGTPISPAFATPEELAHWLADNGASAFGDMTATYEQWLATCKSGWAPSAVFTSQTGLTSGVAATKERG
ncbi:Uncharacterised protein [uncultured archaeon]|nr:Uncharacterised protein [uncultured archaeon]